VFKLKRKGFRVDGKRLFKGSGFRVRGLGFRDEGSGMRVERSRVEESDSGLTVWFKV